MTDAVPPLSELVSWLYGMHKASASMYDAVRSYAENTNGFYAEELRKAVYLTERSGTDIYTAVSSAAAGTKNPAFQKFLSEYLTTVKTSGSPERYLEKKLEELRMEEKAAEEKRAASLSVFAEVFVSVFVAGILFAVIVFLILGLMSGGSLLPLMTIVYGILPLGTAGFLLAVDIFCPSPNSQKTPPGRDTVQAPGEYREEINGEKESIERRCTEMGCTEKGSTEMGCTERRNRTGETGRGKCHGGHYTEGKEGKKSHQHRAAHRNAASEKLSSEEQAILKRLGTYDKYLRARQFLQNPAAELLKKPHLVFVFSIPFAAAVCLLLSVFTRIPFRFSLAAAFLICFTPYAVLSLIQRKKRFGAESEFPSVCRIISSAANRGLPLSKCLAAAAAENTGVLKKGLAAAVRDISFGGEVYKSLFRFADRLSFPSAKRTVLFAAETGRFSGDVSLPFQTGADDAAHSLALQNGRKSGMQLYVLIMYISYFVFIFVQFILSGVFIDAVSAANTAADTGLCLGILTDAVLIHGICCGLAAGKLSGEGVSSGIFHASVLLAAGLAASAAAWSL